MNYEQDVRLYKPRGGHKMDRCQAWFQTTCECGWQSPMCGSTGARAAAYDQWRQHRDKCTQSDSM